jgi:hypothetical protein
LEVQADSIRQPLSKEIVRLIDAFGYHTTRRAATAVAGVVARLAPNEAADLTDRWLPMKFADIEAYNRAQILGQAVSQATSSESSGGSRLQVENENALEVVGRLARTIPESAAELRQQIEKVGPQIQRLMNTPRGAQMIGDVGRGVMQRVAARTLSLLLRREIKEQDDQR